MFAIGIRCEINPALRQLKRGTNMHTSISTALSSIPPTLMVVIVFLTGYLLVGVPVHLTRGAAARDVLGTMAGIFAGIAYLTWVLGFSAGAHPAP
jgi:hypothetical protein